MYIYICVYTYTYILTCMYIYISCWLAARHASTSNRKARKGFFLSLSSGRKT